MFGSCLAALGRARHAARSQARKRERGACGPLTDDVIDLALSVRAKVVVLPCCQSTGKCDLGGLAGWLDPALAIDVTRAAKLRAAGYHVHTQTIPVEITPKNRLLLAAPATS